MRTKSVVVAMLLLLALPLAAASSEGEPRDVVQRLLKQAADNGAKSPVAVVRFGNGKGEPILAYSFGVSNTTTNTGGGGGAGKAFFQDFAFVKQISSASSELFVSCATGKHFPTVTVDVFDSKGTAVAQIKLSEVLISSYQAGSGGDLPVESVTLNFASLEYILIGL